MGGLAGILARRVGRIFCGTNCHLARSLFPFPHRVGECDRGDGDVFDCVVCYARTLEKRTAARAVTFLARVLLCYNHCSNVRRNDS